MDSRLLKHLQTHLGTWPPLNRLTVVGSAQRTKPGWDEQIRPVLGIETLDGTLLSVPPRYAEQIRALGTDLDVVGAALPEVLGKPGWRFGRGFFRWSTAPRFPRSKSRARRALHWRSDWVNHDSVLVPEWLQRFSGPVLVATVENQLAASVGIKRHNHWGHEIAIVTEPEFRGNGIATALVAQAATQILGQGAIPLYIHADDNTASANTAQAAGFADYGWRVVGLFPPFPRANANRRA